MSGELTGRTLLVTGTTGIAAETARMASRSGVRVVVIGIDTESGESLAREVGAEGGDCRFLEADVTDPARVAQVVSVCAADLGRIDALFNVVGISGRRFGDGPLHECTDEGWDRTFETNVRSMFLMSREVLRRMLLQEPDSDGMRGVLLNMASVLAFSPSARSFATHGYAASKGAIIAMSRSAAAYYAPHGIRINAIAPGLVRTPMSRRAQDDPAIVEYMRVKQPLPGGLLEPGDIASTALFLLSPAARSITGQVISVDGGWTVSA